MIPPKAIAEESKEKPFNPEETGKILIPKEAVISPSSVVRKQTSVKNGMGQNSVKDEDEDSEFFVHADMLNYDHGHDQREEVMKNFDEVSFDCFNFRGVYDAISLQFMIYKIFKKYNMVGEESLFFI